jgi:membrane protein YdbS with pleckstrin-like domain
MIRRRETGLIQIQGDNSSERNVAAMRRHGRVLTGPVVLLLATCAVLGFWGGRLAETWMNVALWGAAGAVIVFLVIVPFLVWLGGRVVVTTRRVIIYNGFVIRSKREILLARVTDVTVRRSPLQALLRSGTIVLSMGGDAAVRVRDIPQVALVSAALMQLAVTNEPVVLQRTRDKAEWATHVFAGRESQAIAV